MNAAYILSLFAAIFYGVSAVLEKYILDIFPLRYVFCIYGVIFGIFAAIFSIFYIDDFKKYWTLPYLRPNIYLLISVFTAIIIPHVFYFLALQSTDQTHIVTALTFSAPVFTLLVLKYYTGYKMTISSVCGVVFITVGSILAIYGGHR